MPLPGETAIATVAVGSASSAGEVDVLTDAGNHWANLQVTSVLDVPALDRTVEARAKRLGGVLLGEGDVEVVPGHGLQSFPVRRIVADRASSGTLKTDDVRASSSCRRALRASPQANDVVLTIRLRSLTPSAVAARQPARCACLEDGVVGLACWFPSSLHTVLAVKVCACCARLRPRGRLRTCDRCAAMCRFRSRATPPGHWRPSWHTIFSLLSIFLVLFPLLR